MVVAAQGVGEALRYGRVVTLLPERHHHEFSVAFRPAHVHEVAALRVTHEDGAALAGLDAARRVSVGHPRSDLGLRIEGAAYSLAKALGSVISYRDKQSTAGP